MVQQYILHEGEEYQYIASFEDGRMLFEKVSLDSSEIESGDGPCLIIIEDDSLGDRIFLTE